MIDQSLITNLTVNLTQDTGYKCLYSSSNEILLAHLSTFCILYAVIPLLNEIFKLTKSNFRLSYSDIIFTLSFISYSVYYIGENSGLIDNIVSMDWGLIISMTVILIIVKLIKKSNFFEGNSTHYHNDNGKNSEIHHMA